MTHSLTIKDNSAVELYDLLSSILGIDLGSRQISPLTNGRWQETFQLFAKSNNTAGTVKDYVFDLDGLVDSINDYGDSPAYNSPIWLHEKSEGELTQKRRAPLFRASQQPIVNGAVGPLQINNGYIGLLTLERGDWENVTVTSAIFATAFTSYFDTQTFLAAGSVDGRIQSVNFQSEDTGNQILAVGVRGENFGTTNFQPCVNWGAGTATTGAATTGGTYPTGQPAPVSTGFFWNGTSFLLPSTVKITMAQISLSSLDSVNEDYVGDYTQFLRLAINNTTPGANPDAYVKISPFSGYDGEFIYGDPVYLNVLASEATYADRMRGQNIGNVKIPSDTYVDGAGTSTLSAFTLGLDIEIVGVSNAPFAFEIDSTILIPSNNVIVDNTTAADWNTNIDLSVINDPTGATYLVNRLERVNADITLDATMPREGGVIAYYSEHYDTLGASPIRNVSITYYNRYNSLS